MGLLRAYAFSIYYMYHGCPMVAALACYLLRVTRGYYANTAMLNKFKFGNIDNIPLSEEKMFELYPRTIGFSSRAIISLLYSYTVDQQLRVEDYLDGLTEVQPLDIPEVYSVSNIDSKNFHETSAVHAGDDVRSFNPPPRYPFYKFVNEMNRNIQRSAGRPDFDVFSGLRHHFEH
jgi:hypothetical protein